TYLISFNMFCFPFFWKDLLFLSKVIRYGARLELFKLTARVQTVLDRFVDQAQRIPDKPFIICEGSVHSYRDVDLRSNRLANAFLQQQRGPQRGSCVALFMSNEADFVSAWFGLAKLGCSVAFLNINIRSKKSLLHCFDCCGARTLLIAPGSVYIRTPPSSQSPPPPGGSRSDAAPPSPPAHHSRRS
uniref:Long-chain-fatty-acid--CoA ligase n=1 Tax=Cyprinodon variegatus TaxID=28743 RepID=A0A3Q2D1G2_CYPVA